MCCNKLIAISNCIISHCNNYARVRDIPGKPLLPLGPGTPSSPSGPGRPGSPFSPGLPAPGSPFWPGKPGSPGPPGRPSSPGNPSSPCYTEITLRKVSPNHISTENDHYTVSTPEERIRGQIPAKTCKCKLLLPPDECNRAVRWTCHNHFAFCHITLVLRPCFY